MHTGARGRSIRHAFPLNLFSFSRLELFAEKSMQPFTIARRDFERPIVARYDQHFPRAVQQHRASSAVAEVMRNLSLEFAVDAFVEVIRQFRDYFLTRDHGFIPFIRRRWSLIDGLNAGVNCSWSFMRARCTLVFTAAIEISRVAAICS